MKRLTDRLGDAAVRYQEIDVPELSTHLTSTRKSPMKLNSQYMIVLIAATQLSDKDLSNIVQLSQRDHTKVYLVIAPTLPNDQMRYLSDQAAENSLTQMAGWHDNPELLQRYFDAIWQAVIPPISASSNTPDSAEATLPHTASYTADTRPNLPPDRPETGDDQRDYRAFSPPRLSQRSSILNRGQRDIVDLEETQFVNDVIYGFREPIAQPYPYPHVDVQTMAGLHVGEDDWVMTGASIRGRSHQHDGTYRDDAFRVEVMGGWHVIAVADGAGSAPFSRITANHSVNAAVDTLRRFAPSGIGRDPEQALKNVQRAIEVAMSEVVRTQRDWTAHLNVTPKQTYTTFMLLVHQPLADGTCVIGRWHVGDGFICAFSEDERFSPLTEGDHGAEASTTYFVLSFSDAELARRILVDHLPLRVNCFAVMTDGIEDDLKPSTEAYDLSLIHI
jgi:hypothetical protein